MLALQTRRGGLCQRSRCIYKILRRQELFIFLHILINILKYRTLNIAALKLRDHKFFAVFDSATTFKKISQLEINASVFYVLKTILVLHITAFTPI